MFPCLFALVRVYSRIFNVMVRRLARLFVLRLIGVLLRGSRFAADPPERIVVIKPDHLGDVLLLTPALRLLRRQLPHAHITLLIGPWSRAAVAHNPDVDAILTIPFPGFTRSPKPRWWQPYTLLLKTALLLRAGRFDAAIIARDDHWWGALLAALAGIPQRVGYGVPEVSPFVTHALPHSFGDHVGVQAIRLVEALTGQNAIEVPPLTPPIGEDDRDWAAGWIAKHTLPDAQLVAIHPGAGGAAKLWIAERWAAIADALHDRGMTVVLTGGPAERDLVDTIAAAMRRPPLISVGEASIGQLTALYARCTLVLGVDSGPLHLAVAAGTPTIALFGPGDWQRFGPWGDRERQIVVRSGLWCSPCGVLDACPRGTAPSECMALIRARDVLASIDKTRSSLTARR
jgi:ADP-heptose:LPS heptosyltransferase